MNVTQAGSYLNAISGMPPSLTMAPISGTGASILGAPAPTDSYSAGNAGSALGLGGGMDMSGMSGLSGLGGLGGNAGLSGMSGLGGDMSGLGGMSSMGGLGGMSSMGGLGGMTGMSSMSGMSGMGGMGGLGGMSGGQGGILGMVMQLMMMMLSMITSLLGGQGGGLGGQGGGAGSGAGSGAGQDASSGGAPPPSAGSTGSTGSAGSSGSPGGAPAGDAGNAGFSAPGTTQGTAYGSQPYNDPTQTYAGGYGPTPTGASNPTPTAGNPTPSAGGTPTPTGSGGPSPTGSYTPSSVQGGQLKLFGGSQSGENNLNFTNKSGKDMYIFAQKNLQPGEKDPGGTVFKVPAGGHVSVSAVDDTGLRFQAFHDKLTPDQQSQLDSKGSVDGITVPGKTETLYETNYVSAKHLSYDDISPLDGAKTAMTMSGNGGRTEEISQQVIDNAPGRQADGYVPGVGPSASSTDDAAKNPELRDYYDKMSQNGNGTRKFYYNSSVGGDADQANVSYTGKQGQLRTTIDLG